MTELDRDETEQFITEGGQSKASPAEQVWRESNELGLGVDAIQVELHEANQLRGKFSVKIDDRSNNDDLNRRVLLEPKKRSVRMHWSGEYGEAVLHRQKEKGILT
jgi:hypothetical protein